MAYNQNIVKFSYGWSWRRLKNLDVIIIITIYNSLNLFKIKFK
jgi:hypothetical protein